MLSDPTKFVDWVGVPTPLPTLVKVGYVDYAIETWDHAQADAANRLGEADRVRRIIRVDTSYGPRQSAETLLHEIIHTVWDMWEIRDKGEIDEETIVTPLTKGLATLWRDNPDVFAWLASNLKG